MADATTAKISELASRYVSDNVRLWQRYAEGLRRVSEEILPREPTAAKTGTTLGSVPVLAQQLMQLEGFGPRPVTQLRMSVNGAIAPRNKRLTGRPAADGRARARCPRWRRPGDRAARRAARRRASP